MTETAAVVETPLTQENKREFCSNGVPSLEATLKSGSDLINSESDLMLSPSKRRCVNPKNQYNGDLVLNDGNQPGSNLSFNVNNFVSEIKVTVSDYISQQYLVRGSPNYKVLKDKIREYCLSMKPTGMKDDASCSVLYLVYKSLPELKRTDEADSIIRKMIGKHIRNAKYRAKCKLRECKMTEPDKAATILPKMESQDKVNYSTETLLHPSLLLMLQSEAYKMTDPLRSEMLQTSVRDSQMNIRPSLANKTPTTTSADDHKIVSYGGNCSLAHLNSSTNSINSNTNKQPALSNILSTQTIATSASLLDIPSSFVPSSRVLNGLATTEHHPTPAAETKVKKEASPSPSQDTASNGNVSQNRSPVNVPVRPGGVKPRLLINATRRAEQSPKQTLPRSPTRPADLNEVCEHRLKFITGLTYACFLCNDYFERVPAERLICQHCKKVFSHRHLLLQHNNEAHAFVNASR